MHHHTASSVCRYNEWHDSSLMITTQDSQHFDFCSDAMQSNESPQLL